MTTILFSFAIALFFSLVLTPLAQKTGVIWGAMDMPAERKIHIHPTPRTGGLAIFLAFALSVLVTYGSDTMVSRQIVSNQQTLSLMIGGIICFLTGLVDDFRRVSAWIKLLLQILAATTAFVGGNSIALFDSGAPILVIGLLNYAVTVFWFILFINAVNLVDGLDGLAGGVTFFTCYHNGRQ